MNLQIMATNWVFHVKIICYEVLLQHNLIVLQELRGFVFAVKNRLNNNILIRAFAHTHGE